MADVKISAQTNGTRLAVDDEIPVNRGGTPYRAKALEAGTFTPTLTFGGAAVGLTYSKQVGRWQRIGNRVFFTALVILSAKGSSTGAAVLNGLPVAGEATVDNFQMLPVRPSSLVSTSGSIVALLTAGGTTLAIAQTTTGTTTNLTDANFNNTSQILISGSYEV